MSWQGGRTTHHNSGARAVMAEEPGSGIATRAKEIQQIQQFTSQKWSGIHEISPRYPQIKSSWGSKYFTTQRGLQCPLPRVILTYRSLLTPTLWQNTDKKNLLTSINTFYPPNSAENETLEDEGNHQNIDWKVVCEMTKFAKVYKDI